MTPTKGSGFKARIAFNVWLKFATLFLLFLSLCSLRIASFETGDDSVASQLITASSLARQQIAGKDVQLLQIHLDEGQFLRFTIEKDDLRLSVAVYAPLGSKLIEENSQEFESIESSLVVNASGTYRIEIRSLEKAEASRNYEIRIHTPTAITARDRIENDARQIFAKAQILRASWSRESLREAIVHYDKAAQLWTSISDHANAAIAFLKGADACFVTSEYQEALMRYRRALSVSAKINDRVIGLRAQSRIGLTYSYLGYNDLAQDKLESALAHYGNAAKNAGKELTNAYAEAISSLGEVRYAKGDLAQSLKEFERSRRFIQDDRRTEARVHLFAGYIAGSLGIPTKAVAELSEALNLYRAINNKSGEALTLTALGLSDSLQRNENRAIKSHRDAIDIFHTIGDLHSEAIALNALGQAYENLSEYGIALANYKKALDLYQDTGALDGAAIATFKMARAYRLSGNLDTALQFYERCLALSRAANKVRTEANALQEMAIVYDIQGKHDPAAKQYLNLQKFYGKIGDIRGQASALIAYGDCLFHHDKKQQALAAYSHALPLSEKAGDQGILISNLYDLARAHRDLNALQLALSFIKRSLNIIENSRTNVETADLRASYFSAVRKHFDLAIDILMQLHKLQPNGGFATEGLLLSEKARARSLLDLVSKSEADLRHDAPRDLVDREHELRGLLRMQARYLMELSLAKGESNEKLKASAQINQLRADYQEVLAQLHEKSSQALSLTRSTVVNLEQIQNELRDGSTLLLEYALGDERSYVWAVTDNSLESYELPGREILEEATLSLYKSLTSRGDNDVAVGEYKQKVQTSENLYAEQAKTLSQMLLGPVSEKLGRRKLLFVTEGALQYVPFEALPLSDSQGNGVNTNIKHLIETNEVFAVPSISALIAIRAEQHQSLAPNIAAVFADPVFSIADDRVIKKGLSDGVATGAAVNLNWTPSQIVEQGTQSFTGLVRLKHSAEEADSIVAVAPEGTTMVAKGFDATTESVVASVGHYPILHFATHGFINSEHPELSGIVLSMVDRDAREKNGLMSLRDIYNLHSSAELTVLSSCQTALGKDIEGEGLVGLTHSFLSAGSKTVVASLWKVDDQASAALMAEYYEALLEKGMTTAAALRFAKLKMMQDKRWSAPYFWAGFVSQGEYRNHIIVERGSQRHATSVIVAILVLGSLTVLLLRVWRRRSAIA